MTLGQAIIAATRARYGLPARGAKHVAEALGVSAHTVYAWAGKDSPPAARAATLAAAHGLHIALTPEGYHPVAAPQETPT